MSHHKHHEKLEQLKEAIRNTDQLNDEEKKSAIAHIEEWYEEDKAFGSLLETFVQKFANLKPILAELGLI